MSESDRQLSLAIAKLIESLAEDGTPPPYHFATLASNGYALTGVFDLNAEGKLEPTFTAEYKADGRGLLLPINMMATDRAGRAVHLSVSQDKGLSSPTKLH